MKHSAKTLTKGKYYRRFLDTSLVQIGRALFRILVGRGLWFQLQPLKQNPDVLHLGSRYGAWWICPERMQTSPIIVSCGLGEDATFDIECVSRFGARVFFYDPTPRAIDHFKGLVRRTGLPPARRYGFTGNQPLDAYDLTKVKPHNLSLEPKAIANYSGEAILRLPTNPDHVSGSLQSSARFKGREIVVPCVKLSDEFDRLTKQGLSVDLLKLDIEFSEVVALSDLLDNGWRPTQINVEFDELCFPTHSRLRMIRKCHRHLVASGYKLLASNHRANFFYLHVHLI